MQTLSKGESDRYYQTMFWDSQLDGFSQSPKRRQERSPLDSLRYSGRKLPRKSRVRQHRHRIVPVVEQNICSHCLRTGEGVRMSTDTRLQRRPLARKALLVACLLRLTPAVAQITTCKLFGTPQVDQALVSLDMRAGGVSFRRGKRIHVRLTLRSGSRGVYLPNYFGSFEDTCSHGFSGTVLTLAGKAADPVPHSCASAGQAPLINYVWLKPAEMRTWSTYLETGSIAPGRYCLYAEYLTPQGPFDTGSKLLTNRALIASGRVTANPLLIRVH